MFWCGTDVETPFCVERHHYYLFKEVQSLFIVAATQKIRPWSIKILETEMPSLLSSTHVLLFHAWQFHDFSFRQWHLSGGNCPNVGAGSPTWRRTHPIPSRGNEGKKLTPCIPTFRTRMDDDGCICSQKKHPTFLDLRNTRRHRPTSA